MLNHGRFRLYRQSDSLVHEFALAQRANGSCGYRRTDKAVWIVRSERLGWIAFDDATGDVTGRPWDVPPDQPGDHPPEGDWVSKKSPKSYVYTLRYE